MELIHDVWFTFVHIPIQNLVASYVNDKMKLSITLTLVNKSRNWKRVKSDVWDRYNKMNNIGALQETGYRKLVTLNSIP